VCVAVMSDRTGKQLQAVLNYSCTNKQLLPIELFTAVQLTQCYWYLVRSGFNLPFLMIKLL